MTDTYDIVPSNAEPDITPVLGALSHQPGSVADALDVHLRLTVLSAWVNERKSTVADWLKAKGEARIEEDGAAPTWRLDDGTVLLTDPKPKPAVDDREAFAAWYEAAGGQVERRRTATAASEPLLRFHDAVTRALDSTDDEYATTVALAANNLRPSITVTEDVILPEDVLDELLAGTDLADPDVGARVQLHDSGEDVYLVDTVTGEKVPGTTVRPAAPRGIQVKPTPDAKARVRAELDRLLGAPAIGG